MVQVDEDKRFLRFGIGEAEHAATQARGHFGLHPVVVQVYGVVIGRGLFAFVRVARAVAFVGILGCAGSELRLARAGHEEKVAQVGDARTAQVGQTEAHQRGVVILIARGRIVEAVVRVRAYLDTSEGNLGTGIDVAVAVGTHERIHVIDELLRLGDARRGERQACQCES